MKKSYFIIIGAVVVVGVVLAILLTQKKSCVDLNEADCRMADDCISVLVPNNCANPPCSPDAIFRECKDKE